MQDCAASRARALRRRRIRDVPAPLRVLAPLRRVSKGAGTSASGCGQKMRKGVGMRVRGTRRAARTQNTRAAPPFSIIPMKRACCGASLLDRPGSSCHAPSAEPAAATQGHTAATQGEPGPVEGGERTPAAAPKLQISRGATASPALDRQ